MADGELVWVSHNRKCDKPSHWPAALLDGDEGVIDVGARVG
jgi:hypothetical protein